QQGTPLADARISLAYTGNPERIINEITTDSEGAVNLDDLLTPPVEYSMEPGENQPFSEYTIDVNADGYEEINISGIDVFSGETSIQNVYLNEDNREIPENNIVIPVNTLYGSYPAKIPETEIKPVRQSGEIVLSRVVIPETIVVHDGVPTDSTALDYYVRYKDYIKNVASSEIYSTWPRQTLEANILAIMSFTLNRVYTEWYRNQNYNFTITSSTAFDHKWVNGRNIFESISQVVDEIFDNYLSRPNVKQPILTQYCDGKKSSCPDWMTQWGSKYLGDQGYSSIDILRYYYGDNMYINTAEQIQGIPSSWPGADLDIGSSGQKVRQLQEQLNLIGDYYTAIPALTVDGIYGERTAEAVRQFQRINNMPQTGVVDFPTWYRISDRYVRLSGIAELN
ncbi:MAG: peptidoglycan-binding protein, partial [Lachnospira sp.]|nr:peptidoglycan-binding protein [Lachnospira sp.]